MKATLHLGRGSAMHNDRTFDVSKAEHIDPEKMDKNRYIIYSKNPEKRQMTFEEFEKDFYTERYSAALEQTNANYIKNRHPENVKTMDDWMAKFGPTEAIFQIGTMDEHPDAEKLISAFASTMSIITKKYPQLRPLDMSLHMDETTPHVQFRYVIEGHTKDGHLKPLKEQGLKEMGVPLPEPDKKVGQYNNRNITFTAEVRQTFYAEVQKLGIELDTEPRLDTQHLDTLTYKKQAIASDIEALQASYKAQMESLDEEYTLKADELKSAYETSLSAYSYKEEKLSAKEERLTAKEEALKGRELSLKKLDELDSKTFWSAEDKDNVLKTARMGAKWRSEAKTYKSQSISLKNSNKALKRENARLEAEIPSVTDQELQRAQLSAQKREIEALKEDIRIRDTFLAKNGYMVKFEAFCHDMGYKFKNSIQKISESMHLGFR